MSKDSAPRLLPTLDEHDIAAVFALLIRVMRIDQANKRDRDKIAELQAALSDRVPTRDRYVAAVTAFGFSLGQDIWNDVRRVLSSERYEEARDIARSTPILSESLKEREKLLPAVRKKSAKIYGSEPERSKIHSPNPPKISEAILSYLQSLGDKGALIGDIKRHLLDVHSIEGHEKTPGMTLYRLSKEGVVRRKGRSWYATETSRKGDAKPSTFAYADKEKGD